MRPLTFICLTAAVLLTGCEKGASVQGEPVKKTETTTERKDSKGADYDRSESKVTTKETELPTKLTLNKPSSVSLAQGDTAKFDVTIKRENLTGDVTFRFEKLPLGVEIIDAGQKLSGTGDKATFTLKANSDATVVKSITAQVTAVGPDGMAVSQPIEISISEKK